VEGGGLKKEIGEGWGGGKEERYRGEGKPAGKHGDRRGIGWGRRRKEGGTNTGEGEFRIHQIWGGGGGERYEGMEARGGKTGGSGSEVGGAREESVCPWKKGGQGKGGALENGPWDFCPRRAASAFSDLFTDSRHRRG